MPCPSTLRSLARVVVFLIPLLIAGMLLAQNYVAPSNPQIGSANSVTADPQIPRPNTTPCTVQLFTNLDFADFNPKFFTYTPPANCPGPWSAVVLNADWSIDAGRQFDRTAEIWIGGTNVYFGTTSEPSADCHAQLARGEQSHRLQPAVQHLAKRAGSIWATW